MTELLEETTLAIKMKRMAVTLLDMQQSRFVSASQTMDLTQLESGVYSEFFESYIDATMNSPKSVACKFLDRDNDILTKMNRMSITGHSIKKNMMVKKI